MKRSLALPILVLLGAWAAAQDTPLQPTRPLFLAPADACLRQARDDAAALVAQGQSREEARRALEIAAAACAHPDLPAETTHLIGSVHADRARFARDLFLGDLSLPLYRALLGDRKEKFAALAADLSAQQALLAGDADGDLVPDRSDRCSRTPYGTPTDRAGCPERVPPGDPREDELVRRLLAEGGTLHNPACGNIPPPAPVVLEWGRGRQTKDNTEGFNVAVAKVTSGEPECDVFYHVDFRFEEPVKPNIPPVLNASTLFHDSEDLLSNADRATFGFPLTVALPAPRAKVRQGFLDYFIVTWRVRAVNGNQLASGWSPVVTSGPAPGGVEG